MNDWAHVLFMFFIRGICRCEHCSNNNTNRLLDRKSIHNKKKIIVQDKTMNLNLNVDSFWWIAWFFFHLYYWLSHLISGLNFFFIFWKKIEAWINDCSTKLLVIADDVEMKRERENEHHRIFIEFFNFFSFKNEAIIIIMIIIEKLKWKIWFSQERKNIYWWWWWWWWLFNNHCRPHVMMILQQIRNYIYDV